MTFRNYTQRRTTVGRTSLDMGPARHRDLYLTTHTTLTTDKRPCPRWDSNPRSQQANGLDLGLRPRSHWDRQVDSYPCAICVRFVEDKVILGHVCVRIEVIYRRVSSRWAWQNVCCLTRQSTPNSTIFRLDTCVVLLNSNIGL